MIWIPLARPRCRPATSMSAQPTLRHTLIDCAGREPRTHLLYRPAKCHVPVFLVHIDRICTAVVAHPDTEVLHLQRLALEDLHAKPLLDVTVINTTVEQAAGNIIRPHLHLPHLCTESLR